MTYNFWKVTKVVKMVVVRIGFKRQNDFVRFKKRSNLVLKLLSDLT